MVTEKSTEVKKPTDTLSKDAKETNDAKQNNKPVVEDEDLVNN
jgi:hypothetical protein